MSKIGIGIITCNRPDFLNKLLISLKQCTEYIDEIVIINDGDDDVSLHELDFEYDFDYIQNTTNIHVGASKNKAMMHLINKGCDYIFTLEDDIIIKDKNIFNDYINASKITGLQHFNFGFSQKENLDENLKPIIKKAIKYDDNIAIVLLHNVLGALTFYTREALLHIGLHHTDFNNGHLDHVELTYRAYKHRYGSPFWWFADIHGSWDKIENQSNFTTDSVVRDDKRNEKYHEARNTFKQLHGVDVIGIENIGYKNVIKYLKERVK